MKKITKIAESSSLMDSKKKLRLAAYCRVSTSSDAQLESLDAQKIHYENYINGHDDWNFAGIYYDEGITGTKKEKLPELLRLVDDCKAGKIDFIVTKSISRFSRNTTDCLEIVRDLLALRIPIYFEKENINTGSMDSELFYLCFPPWLKMNRYRLQKISSGPCRSDFRPVRSKSALLHMVMIWTEST